MKVKLGHGIHIKRSKIPAVEISSMRSGYSVNIMDGEDNKNV